MLITSCSIKTMAKKAGYMILFAEQAPSEENVRLAAIMSRIPVNQVRPPGNATPERTRAIAIERSGSRPFIHMQLLRACRDEAARDRLIADEGRKARLTQDDWALTGDFNVEQ